MKRFENIIKVKLDKGEILTKIGSQRKYYPTTIYFTDKNNLIVQNRRGIAEIITLKLIDNKYYLTVYNI